MKNRIRLTQGQPLRAFKWVNRAAFVAALAACGGSAGDPSFGDRQDNLLAETEMPTDPAAPADLFAEAPAPTAGAATQKCKKSNGDDDVSDGESDGDDVSDGDDDVSDGESDGDDDVSDGDDDGDEDCVPAPAEPPAPDLEVQ